MIALLLHSAVVCLGIQTEYVDCIELNHQHDDKGCYVFSQVIAWEFVPETKQKHVGVSQTPVAKNIGRNYTLPKRVDANTQQNFS